MKCSQASATYNLRPGGTSKWRSFHCATGTFVLHMKDFLINSPNAPRFLKWTTIHVRHWRSSRTHQYEGTPVRDVMRLSVGLEMVVLIHQNTWRHIPEDRNIYVATCHGVSSSSIPQWFIQCPRRNVPDFGRVFLMLKYTDITQNTYIQSWTVTEIIAREVWNFDSCYTLIDYQIHIKTGRNMLFL